MVLCARIAAHTRERNALDCFQMVTEYLAQGFGARGLQVVVELVHADGIDSPIPSPHTAAMHHQQISEVIHSGTCSTTRPSLR
jgi:hypothetical protein